MILKKICGENMGRDMGWKKNFTIFMLNNSFIYQNIYYTIHITKKLTIMYSYIRYLSRKLTKAWFVSRIRGPISDPISRGNFRALILVSSAEKAGRRTFLMERSTRIGVAVCTLDFRLAKREQPARKEWPRQSVVVKTGERAADKSDHHPADAPLRCSQVEKGVSSS